MPKKRKSDSDAACRKAEYHRQSRIKWETGKSLPDSSIMLELCDILNITVNDLLTGEKVIMENYNKELEKNLISMIKQKEESDRNLLRIEIVLGVCCLFWRQ